MQSAVQREADVVDRDAVVQRDPPGEIDLDEVVGAEVVAKVTRQGAVDVFDSSVSVGSVR